MAFRTPATFVHSHHFKLLSHMLPFTEHLPSTDFQSTDACSLSMMATTALKETYRFPCCNSCTNAWHVLPGESLSTLNFLAFVESVKKSDKLQLWQLFQITLLATSWGKICQWCHPRVLSKVVAVSWGSSKSSWFKGRLTFHFFPGRLDYMFWWWQDCLTRHKSWVLVEAMSLFKYMCLVTLSLSWWFLICEIAVILTGSCNTS